MRSALVALLLLPLVASAQDMPLFTFTKSGEGWVNPNRVEGIDYVDALVLYLFDKVEADFKFRNGGDKYSLAYPNNTSLRDRPRKGPRGKITAVTRTPDKGTVYVAFDDDDSVWAFTPDKDNKLTNGAPYAPLRIRKGYDNSDEARRKQKVTPPTLAVHELTLDSAGRLYAATSQDLQVFDPTGRLSGVLTLPAKGKVEAMTWEGKEKDTLAMWIDGKKWTRTMKP
jgi:hypothetical protein